MFVDDLLLFTKASAPSASNLKHILDEFSDISGLHINEQKSTIFFGGVGEELKTEILNLLTVTEGALPVKYLGVPLAGRRLQVAHYQPLLDRILALLQN